MLDLSKINPDPWNYTGFTDKKKKNLWRLIQTDPYNVAFVKEQIKGKPYLFSDYIDVLEHKDIYIDEIKQQKINLLKLHKDVIEGTSEYNALNIRRLIKKLNKSEDKYQTFYNNLSNTNTRLYCEYMLCDDKLNISSKDLQYLPRYKGDIQFKKISEMLEIMYSTIFLKKDKVKLFNQQYTYVRNRFAPEEAELLKSFLDKKNVFPLTRDEIAQLLHLWYNFREKRNNTMANSLHRIKAQTDKLNKLYLKIK